ncbi:hypothetical protein BH10ACT3_BH10ACT3_08970 [soil metagenome]
MQPQPLIALADVDAGSRWFQHVLGLSSGHGGTEYEMLMDGTTMVAQLHEWHADAHEHLGDVDDPSRGNGVLLWFQTDDFDALVDRATTHSVSVLEGPFVNPNSGQREVWMTGPEGHTVFVAGPAA